MIKEALEVFKHMFDENGEALIIDSYIPKDGTYRIIELTDDNYKILKTLEIKNDKKNNTIIGSEDEDYKFICELDYYSKLIEMNKPIDSKKIIHTNNYLSLAIKKENLLDGINSEIYKGYYEILKNPLQKYSKKNKTKNLYVDMENNIGKPNINLIDKIENIVLNNNLYSDVDLTKKNYLKIFFVFSDKNKTIELYKNESIRYLLPNIYNNNDFNMVIENEILGFPNNNIGLNSKKPYLENKTRKVTIPYLINQEDVLMQAKLFDYLMTKASKGEYHIYITDNSINSYDNKKEPEINLGAYYLRIKKGKNEVEIQYAEAIPEYKSELDKKFKLMNYMCVDENKSYFEYGKNLSRLWNIKYLIDKVFFEGKLENNIYTEPKELSFSNSYIKKYFLQSRDTLSTWFYTGNKTNLDNFIEKITLKLIETSLLSKNKFENAKEQFNLRWSLIEYFYPNRKIGEKMNKVVEDLREHINMPKETEWNFNSDEEYSFAVGQVVYYLLSLSKSNVKSHSVLNPFLNATKDEIIKKHIFNMYKKYNYILEVNKGFRFDKILSRIMMYNPKKLYKEQIMAGFVYNSLIYEKGFKENNSEMEEN